MSRRKLVMGNSLLASYSSASQVNISFQHLDDASGKVGTEHSDALMTWKYLFIFANAMLAVVLMLVELQVAYDRQTGKLDAASKAGRTLRFLITFLTILLLVQLIDYYNGLLAVMTNSWKHARINTGFNISVWSVIRSSQVGAQLWVELILCSLHAPPIASVDGKVGLLMLVRFYMIFRVLRDRSVIYKRRNTIMRKYMKYGIKHWGPPRINWFLAVKSIYGRRPFTVVISATAWTLWVCGHVIYIYEREIDKNKFTYEASQYLSMISMITGWPTDTYEVYVPMTFMGKTACIMSTLVGLFLLSMLLEVLSSWFAATPHQRPAIVWSHRQDIKHELRDSAARIIQLVWRKHMRSSTVRATSSFVERKARCTILPRESLGTRYVNAVKDFRRLMRQKVSLHVNFAESQNNNLADFDDAPLPRSHPHYSDDDSYVQDTTGRGDVEERLRSMESLILNLSSKLDSLVPKASD